MADGMLRSPTFLVGAEKQKKNLEEFQRREQQLAEAYHKNKPLCFNATSYQKTHPVKAQKGHKDADACLTAPLVLGVADGVSQIEDFGIDASLLPNELLKVVEQLGMHQLVPDTKLPSGDHYQGPVAMLRRAFQATEALGSLTVVLAIMDNSTKIHGKLHPMIAVITIGDCELIILRRASAWAPMSLACHTEMQRIDGHAQTPLQLARVDERIDPDFHEDLTIEVIERGSAVHCVTAYEGDIVLMGSDGVFDNLFLDEIVDLANNMLPPRQGRHPAASLHALSQRIVELCHAKTRPMPNGVLPDAPIGRGGKKDDTSCVVGEIVEWTEEMKKAWTPKPDAWLGNFGLLGSLLGLERCCVASYDSDDEDVTRFSAKPTVPTPMGGFPYASMKPNSTPPSGMQHSMPPSGMQNGIPANGMQGMLPNGMKGVPLNGMSSNGMQNGMAPNGMQSSMPHGGMPHGGMPNGGMPPHSMPANSMQNSMPPNAMLDSMALNGMQNGLHQNGLPNAMQPQPEGGQPDQMKQMMDMQPMRFQRPTLGQASTMTWPPQFHGQMYSMGAPPLNFGHAPASYPGYY